MNSKLLKLSAKYAFKTLREKSPYFSEIISKKIEVNRMFWNHLNFSKDRTREETEERLLLLPFLETILNKGNITSQKNNFIRIEYEIEKFCISVIILQKGKKYILLSIFLVYKKNDLPPA